MAFPVNSKPNAISGGQVTEEDKVAFQGVSVKDRLKLVAGQIPVNVVPQPRTPINPTPTSPNAPKTKVVAQRQLPPADLPPPFPAFSQQPVIIGPPPPSDLPPPLPTPLDLPPPVDLPPALPVRARRPLPSPVKDIQSGFGGDVMAELKQNRVMQQRKEYADQYVVGATKMIHQVAKDMGFTFNEQAMTFTGPMGEITFSAFKTLSLEKASSEPQKIEIAANELRINVQIESVSREDLSQAFAEYEKAFNAKVCNEIRQNTAVMNEAAKQGYQLNELGYFTNRTLVKTAQEFENDVASESFARQLEKEEQEQQLQAERNRNKSIGDQYGLTVVDMLKIQEYVQEGYEVNYVGGYLSKGSQGEEGFMTFDEIKNEVRSSALPYNADPILNGKIAACINNGYTFNKESGFLLKGEEFLTIDDLENINMPI